MKTKTMHYDGPLAEVWDLGLSFTGIKRGVQAFVRRLPIVLPRDARIFEVGCGTGVVSIALARKFPQARILATDLEPDMLREARGLVAREGLDDRITFARANAQRPRQIEYLHGCRAEAVGTNVFDLVVASAVLEHTDITEAIPALIDLAKPGGHILDIGMNGTNVVGRAVGKIFRFKPIPAEQVCELFEKHGCTARILEFDWKEAPANLTRVGILAQKRQ